jgi:DNA-binding beta-propeller fold protein YncE
VFIKSNWEFAGTSDVGGLSAAVAAAVFLRILGAISISAAALGCATGTPPPPNWSQPEAHRVWPVSPERPRVEFMGFLRTPADLGRSVGFLERVKTAIFGTDPVALLKPIAVAKNNSGILVVSDPTVPVVHLFDLERREYRSLTGDSDSPLRSPIGVAIDDAGRVYVADSILGRVFVFDERGEVVAEFGAGELTRPTGLALDPTQDKIYVVDTIACAVFVYDRGGNKIGRFGRRGVDLGEFNSPTFIAVSPDGTINVSDSLNFRVQRFRPDGTPIASFGLPGDRAGHFARPKGISVDSEGRLYIVDAAFESIQIFEPDGELLLSFGEPGNGVGELSLPGGVFVDASGTIWVADSFNRRIQVFRLLSGTP